MKSIVFKALLQSVFLLTGLQLAGQVSFQKHFTPIEYYVTDNNSFTLGEVNKGPDGRLYISRIGIAVCDANSRQVDRLAVIRCGGNPIAMYGQTVVYPNGQFYAVGSAYGPDSAACGAGPGGLGDGSYDAIAGSFNADGTMRWGRALNNFRLADAFSDVYGLPDRSLVAIGNKFRNLRIAHFGIDGEILADEDLGIAVTQPKAVLSQDSQRVFSVDINKVFVACSPDGDGIRSGTVDANGFVIDDFDQVLDVLTLPDGNLAIGMVARIASPFRRVLQVLKVDTSGRVLGLYRSNQPYGAAMSSFADMKLINGKLYVAGEHGAYGSGTVSGISLAILDAITLQPEMEESYSGGAYEVQGIEALDERGDTLLISAKMLPRLNRRLAFTKFTEQQLYGLIMMVRCAATAEFGFTSQDRTTSFTHWNTGENVDFSWDFGDGSTSFLENPSHTFSQDGNYTVCLTSRTANLCEKTVCQTVQIPNGSSSVLTSAEAAASVSASYRNGEVMVKSANLPIERIRVFDALGRKVLESPTLHDVEWSYSGLVLPKGYYALHVYLSGQKLPVVRSMLSIE